MQPEDIDKLFRDQLREHAPAPPAYLWNQLEAELQPAKKRPAMWLYAAAAVVALLLVAGGAWLGQTPGLNAQTGPLTASTGAPAHRSAPGAAPRKAASEKTAVAQATPAPATPSTLPEANRADLSPSVAAAPATPAPTARPAAHRVPVAAPQLATGRPAAGTRPAAPATQAVPRSAGTSEALATAPTRPERPAAVEQAPNEAPAAVAQASVPAAPTGAIEVEVHRGGSAPPVVAQAAGPDQHRLMGRLLRKAGSAALREVRDKVDVPVLTLNVLNHSVSTKDIQL